MLEESSDWKFRKDMVKKTLDRGFYNGWTAKICTAEQTRDKKEWAQWAEGILRTKRPGEIKIPCPEKMRISPWYYSQLDE